MQEQQYYVYLLLDPRWFSQVFYVGKGSGGRFRHHFTGKDKRNKLKTQQIAEIYAAGLQPMVVFYSLNMSETDAYDLETILIMRLGRIGFDKDGVLTNRKIKHGRPDNTGRTRFKKGQAAWNKGRCGIYNHDSATRKKMSLSRTGREGPTKGMKLSDEHKRRISEGGKGRIVTLETRAKIRAGNRRTWERKNKPKLSDD